MKHVKTLTMTAPAKAEGIDGALGDLMTCLKEIIQNPLGLIQKGSNQ